MTTCRPPSRDLLTVEQFADYMQASVDWVRRQLPKMPGVIRRERKFTRIHLPTYLEKSVRK